jgi:hypothetical protein
MSCCEKAKPVFHWNLGTINVAEESNIYKIKIYMTEEEQINTMILDFLSNLKLFFEQREESTAHDEYVCEFSLESERYLNQKK